MSCPPPCGPFSFKISPKAKFPIKQKNREPYRLTPWVTVLKKSDNYSIIEKYTGLELKELGYTTEQIKEMKNISLYDEILLKPTK